MKSPVRPLALAATAALAATSVIAMPAQATPSDLCSALSPMTSVSDECKAPGTLGSGRMVGIHVTLIGGGGAPSSYDTGDYLRGGSGAVITADLSVPEGTVLSVYAGEPGEQGDSGAGSSAIVMGSQVLLEAGGGGTSSANSLGGSGAGNGTLAGTAGEGPCAGQGGNADGAGTGGAGGIATGECDVTDASPGSPGLNGYIGTGGRGGWTGTDTPGAPGGAGYADGGAGGGGDNAYPGMGGGGGYGGGGGGAQSYGDSDTRGSGGGGGSYVDYRVATNVSLHPATSEDGYGYSEDGDEHAEGGVAIISGAGPTVKTEQSAPTDKTETSVKVHSNVNPGAVDAAVAVEYSTAADFATIAGSTASSPSTVAANAGDTDVTTSLTGLTKCTTYYYRVKASSTDGLSTGTVSSFATECPPAPGPNPGPDPAPHPAIVSIQAGKISGAAPNAKVNLKGSTKKKSAYVSIYRANTRNSNAVLVGTARSANGKWKEKSVSLGGRATAIFCARVGNKFSNTIRVNAGVLRSASQAGIDPRGDFVRCP